MPGILGVGIDILHLPRLRSLLSRRDPLLLAKRILSAPELAEWEDIPPQQCARRERFLAVRWTAKEAAYKALYPAVRATWKDLRFHRPDGSPKPVLDWLGSSDAVGRLHVSVSHDGEYVAANVLAEEKK
ncbi:hypothetical protein BOTBODRAFT_185729 [Botryobasidium botryosum FD-172 SS1]|uniref:4'-phosphopantetheinyl transferase domain-containing protein n=1 Tax=Botryobasidium botryosum (strain FD-172 SS1) TaxID=930990 RepID=A0A067MSA2_BOTB1|nr:hypothetical protein BOTBODRAFT_185729 [Botryobasidium botryosum FD-172 SS1]